MRTLLKINFIILAIAAFFIVYRQAFMQRYDKFYYEEGKVILSGNSLEEKYQQNPHLFFYEAKGFHQNEAIFHYDNGEIQIDIYEVSFPDHEKDNIHNVVTYLMPIITADKDVFSDKDATYGIYFATEKEPNLEPELAVTDEEELVNWFKIIDFVNLGIFLADTGYGELVPVITGEEIDLLNEKPLRIEIFKATEFTEDNVDKIKITRFLTVPFTIDENSFPVRNELINLFHNKQTSGLAKEITEADIIMLEEDFGIYFTAFHNASKYNSVLYLWLGGYLLVVLIAGYFVFYFRRDGGKKLGKEKPTEALKESIKQTKEAKTR